MITKAKIESECLRCGEMINAGEKIEWKPGDESAQHKKCPTGILKEKGLKRACNNGNTHIEGSTGQYYRWHHC